MPITKQILTTVTRFVLVRLFVSYLLLMVAQTYARSNNDSVLRGMR